MEEEKNVNEYKGYKAKDFALDPYFVDWVKYPSEDQNVFWEKFGRTFPDKQNTIQTAKALVLTLQFDDQSVSSEELERKWKDIRSELASRENIKRKKKNSGYGTFLRMAALLVLVLSILFALNKFNTSLLASSEPVEIQKETLKGQKLTVMLPDHSIVKLNAESKITYSDPFAENERQVILEGEAFFEVIHNPEKPFIVRTGNISTIVRGTSFNVQAYPQSSFVQVALAEGSVMVKNNDPVENKGVALRPGEMLTVGSDGHFNSIVTFEYDDILGWKDGHLNFNTVSFPEALESMERWYGVEFIIDENVTIDPQWRFHGKFKDRSLGYILKTMSYPNLFGFKIKGEKVLIYKS